MAFVQMRSCDAVRTNPADVYRAHAALRRAEEAYRSGSDDAVSVRLAEHARDSAIVAMKRSEALKTNARLGDTDNAYREAFMRRRASELHPSTTEEPVGVVALAK